MRERIGRWSDVATRHLVYKTDAAIEIDEHDHFEILRRRVFFDDVVFVTYHKELGGGYVAVMVILFLIFAGVAILSRTVMPLMIPFIILALACAVLAAIRVTMLLDVVTVFGKRTKASVRFGMRKAKAREVFDDICTRVDEAQQRRRAEIAAVEPPPPPPPPMVYEPPPRLEPTDAGPPPEQ